MKISAPVAREWFSRRTQTIRSWSDFVNTNQFCKPSGTTLWTKRVVKNLEHYQTNYLFVFTGLIVYCILTSPLLLIAIAVFLAACYFINAQNEHKRLKLFGKEITNTQQYGLAACFSFPLFFVAGAGAAVFWVLGVSFSLVALHASFHVSTEEGTPEKGNPFVETV